MLQFSQLGKKDNWTVPMSQLTVTREQANMPLDTQSKENSSLT